METAAHSKAREEAARRIFTQRPVPLLNLPDKVQKELALCLDHESLGKDYKDVAEMLGFSPEKANWFKTLRHHGSRTLNMLAHCAQDFPNTTVLDLFIILEKLGRIDAVLVLCRHVQLICSSSPVVTSSISNPSQHNVPREHLESCNHTNCSCPNTVSVITHTKSQQDNRLPILPPTRPPGHQHLPNFNAILQPGAHLPPRPAPSLHPQDHTSKARPLHASTPVPPPSQPSGPPLPPPPPSSQLPAPPKFYSSIGECVINSQSEEVMYRARGGSGQRPLQPIVPPEAHPGMLMWNEALLREQQRSQISAAVFMHGHNVQQGDRLNSNISMEPTIDGRSILGVRMQQLEPMVADPSVLPSVPPPMHVVLARRQIEEAELQQQHSMMGSTHRMIGRPHVEPMARVNNDVDMEVALPADVRLSSRGTPVEVMVSSPDLHDMEVDDRRVEEDMQIQHQNMYSQSYIRQDESAIHPPEPLNLDVYNIEGMRHVGEQHIAPHHDEVNGQDLRVRPESRIPMDLSRGRDEAMDFTQKPATPEQGHLCRLSNGSITAAGPPANSHMYHNNFDHQHTCTCKTKQVLPGGMKIKQEYPAPTCTCQQAALANCNCAHIVNQQIHPSQMNGAFNSQHTNASSPHGRSLAQEHISTTQLKIKEEDIKKEFIKTEIVQKGNTYPRCKKEEEKDKKNMNPVKLTPSKSADGDVQKAEFKQGSRKMRVFVTYAFDSKQHVKDVINMASTLRNNGFGVTVDEPPGGSSVQPAKKEERLQLMKERYRKADFVVICVSPDYIKAVETPDAMEKKVNTHIIFNLIRREYGEALTQGDLPRKFTIAMFPSATESHIPQGMVYLPRFHWPHQWKDLMYHINKPDQIVRNHVWDQRRV